MVVNFCQKVENEGKKRMKAQGKHKEDNRGEITTIETENQ